MLMAVNTVLVLAVTCLAVAVEAETEVSVFIGLRTYVLYKFNTEPSCKLIYIVFLGENPQNSIALSPVYDPQVVDQTCHYPHII